MVVSKLAQKAASRHCLTPMEMLLSANRLEQIVLGYFVPVLILFGVTGNFINLTVLMAPTMKSRSNTLLAALALCDMAFLAFMLPHCLAHYQLFALDNAFRRVYFASKIHLIALLNWTSAAAIWLVLTICMERLIAIRYPLSSRKYCGRMNYLLIVGIVTVTALLTFYNHVSYDCVIKEFCNGTQIHSFCLPVDSNSWPSNMSNLHSTWLRRYVRWSPHVNAIFVVFLPTVIVCFSNVLLILTLRKRQRFLRSSTSCYSIQERRSQKAETKFFESSNSEREYEENGEKMTAKRAKFREYGGLRQDSLISATTNNNYGSPSGGGNGSSRKQQMRLEQKVTLTVCAIVTCFTITQSPSAIVTLATGFVEIGSPIHHVYLRILTTFMIVIGKSLNFVLFCLSSANFRRRLRALMKARFRNGSKNNSANGYNNTTATTVAMHNCDRNGNAAKKQFVRQTFVDSPKTHVNDSKSILNYIKQREKFSRANSLNTIIKCDHIHDYGSQNNNHHTANISNGGGNKNDNENDNDKYLLKSSRKKFRMQRSVDFDC